MEWKIFLYKRGNFNLKFCNRFKKLEFEFSLPNRTRRIGIYIGIYINIIIK